MSGVTRAQLASPAAQAAMLRRMHAAPSAPTVSLADQIGAMGRMLGGGR